MRVSVAKAVSVLSATAVIAICSCEKHPVGQMPDFQREQPDPAKVWPNATTKNPDESSGSPTPSESFQHEAR
jgi:hypothetical protein